MSLANQRPRVSRDGVEQFFTQWPVTVSGNIESSELQTTTPAVIDPDTLEEITPAVVEMVVVDGPRPLSVAEVVAWDESELSDEVADAKDRTKRSVDWANDKSTKLNTFAGLSEAETRPDSNATALAYIQFLYDNVPKWARWHSKHMKGAADAIFGTGETDAADQDPV